MYGTCAGYYERVQPPNGTTLAAWMLARGLITQEMADDPAKIEYYDEEAETALEEFEAATNRHPLVIGTVPERKLFVPRVDGAFLFHGGCFNAPPGGLLVETAEGAQSDSFRLDLPNKYGSFSAIRSSYGFVAYAQYYVTALYGYLPEIDRNLFGVLAARAATAILDQGETVPPDAGDAGALKKVTEGPVTYEYAVGAKDSGGAETRRDQWQDKWDAAVSKYEYAGVV